MYETIRLLTPDEAAAVLRVSRRRLLQLPIRRTMISERTLRYRFADLCTYLGIDAPPTMDNRTE